MFSGWIRHFWLLLGIGDILLYFFYGQFHNFNFFFKWSLPLCTWNTKSNPSILSETMAICGINIHISTPETSIIHNIKEMTCSLRVAPAPLHYRLACIQVQYWIPMRWTIHRSQRVATCLLHCQQAYTFKQK